MISSSALQLISSLLLLHFVLFANGTCISSTTQNTAMCNLATGFAPLPASLSLTWVCTLGKPVTDPCLWNGVRCNPNCQITSLNLANGGLQGTLSSSIGDLSMLQGLFLYSNSIRGTIPPSISKLVNLLMLEIDHNKFTGSFPTSICSGVLIGTALPAGTAPGLVKLFLFQADFNSFTCLPTCLFKLKPQNFGMWGMVKYNAGGVYKDPTTPQCIISSPSPSRMPTATRQPTHTAAPAPTKIPTTSAQFKWQSGIYYSGGGINTGTTYMYNVFYGNWNNLSSKSFSNPATSGLINHFTKYTGGSSWFGVLTTYWDFTGLVPRSAVLNGSFFVNTVNYAKSINQNDIENTVFINNIASGKIYANPGYPYNAYNFFPSDDVRIDKYGIAPSGVQYAVADCVTACGFHSYVMTTVHGVLTRIKYTVQVNQNSKAICGCTWYQGTSKTLAPNSNIVADSFAYIWSHEIAELVTDTSRGWNGCTGCALETGDVCIWRSGSGYFGDFLYYNIVNPAGVATKANVLMGGKYFHISPIWVNYGHGCCSMSYPFVKTNGEVYYC